MTKAQLRMMQVRQERADVLELLWEVKRLRGLVLRAHQLTQALGSLGGAAGVMLDGLRHELKDEPCVREFPQLADKDLEAR